MKLEIWICDIDDDHLVVSTMWEIHVNDNRFNWIPLYFSRLQLIEFWRKIKSNFFSSFFWFLLARSRFIWNIPIFSLEIKWNASHSKICFPSHVNTRSYSKFHTTFFCGKIMKPNYSGLSTTAIIPQKKQQYRFSVHMWK